MKPLSEALNNTLSTLQQQEAQQPTQPPGSTTTGGALTTAQHSSSAMQCTAAPQWGRDRQRMIEQEQQLCAQQGISDLLLRDDQAGKQKLAARLYRDFHAMRTYGKEPESLESIVSLFNEVLADYPTEKIMTAMHEYAKERDEFPTPHDIAKKVEEFNGDWQRRMRSFEMDISRREDYFEFLKRCVSKGIPLLPKHKADLERFEAEAA